ncbi:hypothetical protein M569_06801 [Genlisea aurea]|uniref:Uncharacterized protein n=1 Tax=Genlisea aurea TaxID=192259 RepID=S8CMN5_9LAMI|nr:hypothetical protein M569_06801 [Genlisea aurea]
MPTSAALEFDVPPPISSSSEILESDANSISSNEPERSAKADESMVPDIETFPISSVFHSSSAEIHFVGTLNEQKQRDADEIENVAESLPDVCMKIDMEIAGRVSEPGARISGEEENEEPIAVIPSDSTSIVFEDESKPSDIRGKICATDNEDLESLGVDENQLVETKTQLSSDSSHDLHQNTTTDPVVDVEAADSEESKRAADSEVLSVDAEVKGSNQQLMM